MSGSGLALAGPGGTLDRGALDEAIGRAAATLLATETADGRTPGRIRLAVVARPSVEAVIAFHAGVRTGATLAMLDPRLPAAEVGRLLALGGVEMVMADDPDAIPRSAGHAVVALDGLHGVAKGAPAPPDRTPGAVVLVPTSGTTGARRLARLPWAALEASARAWSAVLPEATGWLLSLGIGHVAGIGVLVRAARARVPVVVPAGMDTAGLLDAIEEAARRGIAVSHLSLVPTQLMRLLEATPAGAPPGLRAVLLGGGPIPGHLVEQAAGAGWPVVPSYGMTETASGIAALPVDEAAVVPEAAGRPLPGVELRIDEPRGVAGSGRILVRGPMVFAGYEGDPGATATAIGPDGWLRTGDLGWLDPAGRLVVIDRIDDVVISGGENVVPATVERVLLEHPAVADAAVAGVADDEWGAVPVAAVVPRPGRIADEADIRAFVRDRLAAFEVPARVVFLGRLPRTESGKLRRRTLRPWLEAAPLAVDDLAGPSADAPTVLLLHATLSSARQLRPLAERLAMVARVLVPDRRGSGRTAMAEPAPLPLARHVADALEVLDRAGVAQAIVVGHSFGGVVGLELAARHPDRVTGLFAWEPPYVALAPPIVRSAMEDLAVRVCEAHAAQGPAAAAELFLDAVAGPGTWAALSPRQREALGAAGDGVLADVMMPDLVPGALGRIAAQAILATGRASEPFYRPIAEALAARIPRARAVSLDGLRHPAPITDPDRVADTIRDLVVRLATPGEDAP